MDTKVERLAKKLTRTGHLLVMILVLSSTKLIAQRTELWGMTLAGGEYGVGAIYKTDQDGNNQEVVYSFDAGGAKKPSGTRLIHATDGNFYGMTNYGGKFNRGAIFRYNTLTKTIETVHSFDPEGGYYPLGSLHEIDGVLYGMTNTGGRFGYGIIFSFTIADGNFKDVFDFADAKGGYPYGSLISKGNVLYGLSNQGGDDQKGSIFCYDLTKETYKDLYSFDGADHGRMPTGDLTLVNNTLYGASREGGDNGKGLIFKYNILDDIYTVLHSFNTTDGYLPEGKLTYASNGRLYGTISSGGNHTDGVLYSINPSSNDKFTLIHHFQYSSPIGGRPYGTITEGSDGMLYGLSLGGRNGAGVVYQYNPNERSPEAALKDVHLFRTNGLTSPRSDLIRGKNGEFFGLAQLGGEAGLGGIFKFNLDEDNPVLEDVASFKSDFYYPVGGLMMASDGNLYGVASTQVFGASNGHEAIFTYDLAAREFKEVANFTEINGRWPNGELVELNGKIYGTCRIGGAKGDGLIFELDLSDYTFKNVYNFPNNEAGGGRQPRAGLTVYNGKLYGSNPSSINGVVYEFDPTVANGIRHLASFDGTNGKHPFSTMVVYKDRLYGTTFESNYSSYHKGALFSLDPNAANIEIRAEVLFGDEEHGIGPLGLTLLNDKFYGLTTGGGKHSSGVLFEFDPNHTDSDPGNAFVKKLDFNSNNSGRYPKAKLVASNGFLYGTTSQGRSKGNVFRFDPNAVEGSNFQVTHWFDGKSGQDPYSNMLIAIEVKDYTNLKFELENATYGMAAHDLRVFTDTRTPILISSSDTDVASVTDGQITYKGAGTTIITASQSATSSHYQAKVERTLQVTPATLEIIAKNASRKYGDANPELTIEIHGFVNGENPDVLDNKPEAFVEADEKSKPGEYIISVNELAAANYEIQITNGVLTIEKLTQSIEFPEIEAKDYSSPAFSLNASSDAGLSIIYEVVDEAVAKIEGDQASITGAGSTIIRAVQPGNAYYEAAKAIEQTLQVDKATQTISFDELIEMDTEDDLFELKAESTSGLTISYTSSDEKVATVDGNVITIVGAGSTTITASQYGNDNYLAATDVSQELKVSSVLDVRNERSQSTYRLYPNPVSDMMVIRTEHINTTLNHLQLINATGRVVAEPIAQSINQEWKVDLRAMEPGQYILKMTFNDHVITKKLIKR